MHPRNSFAIVPILLILLLTGAAGAQDSFPSGVPSQSPEEAKPADPKPEDAKPTDPKAGDPKSADPKADPPSNSSSTPKSSQQAQSQSEQDQGGFVFHKQVDEVLLHATVVDDKQRMVTNLDKAAFTVFEDGKPQTIISFRHEDIPVAMGIVIDNSGSMREKRDKVNKAAINLVKASNAQDQVFIVNFNDEYYLDQDFTADLNKLREALEKVETRGGTALYDAVVASGEHLKKNGKLEKKVLFVVTDGEDNASRESLEQAVKRLQEENGPTVYAIGLLGEERQRRAKKALQLMAERTGGISFFPKTLDEVDEISKQVAHDIRNQYTLGYKPSNPKSSGGYRQIKVEAKSKGYGKLTVRTKSGYYAGQERASTAGD
jgi:Ca-activated chloride channel family protein